MDETVWWCTVDVSGCEGEKERSWEDMTREARPHTPMPLLPPVTTT
jgi:hypothetical protein